MSTAAVNQREDLIHDGSAPLVGQCDQRSSAATYNELATWVGLGGRKPSDQALAQNVIDYIDNLEDRIDAAEAEVLREAAKALAQRADLLAALSAAQGYMFNAAIDLETSTPKLTALQTLEGGVKLVKEAILKARA